MSDRTFVGMQVGGISFIDEGIEETLDIFQESAGVNAIFISALSWARGNAGRSGSNDFPDHGGQEPDHLQGGAFFPPDPRYYHGTSIKDFTAPDPLYEGWDILGDVIPAARERDIEVFPYYCETSHKNPKPLWQPGFAQVLEVDPWGRKATRPCLYNPDYRNWWFGVIDNWLNEYDLNGVLWGIEREDPLSSMIVSDEVPTCFCVHCRTEAHRRGIDAGRAAEGYRKIHGYLASVRDGYEPRDGKLITFLRHLFEYPEVSQWQKLWWDGHKDLYREISGLVRFFGDGYQVGLRDLADDQHLQPVAAGRPRPGRVQALRRLAQARVLQRARRRPVRQVRDQPVQGPSWATLPPRSGRPSSTRSSASTKHRSRICLPPASVHSTWPTSPAATWRRWGPRWPSTQV